MKLIILLFSLSTFLMVTSSFGQNQNLKDSSIDVIPNWLKGEIHNLKIESTTINKVENKPNTFLSTFDATFKIIEVSESGYKIEWTYTKSILAPGDLLIENHLLSKFINTKMVVEFSNVGIFMGLVNVQEVKTKADEVIDELIANSIDDKEINLQFKAAKQIMTSTQGLEIVLLKQLKLFVLPFGYNYKLNFKEQNNIKYPNPLGGDPIEAKEIVQLTKPDNLSSFCRIETDKIVDSITLRNIIFEVAKKVSKEMEDIVQEEFRNNGFQISENTKHEINFSKGIVLNAHFKRVMKLGFQNRTTLLEIKEVK